MFLSLTTLMGLNNDPDESHHGYCETNNVYDSEDCW